MNILVVGGDSMETMKVRRSAELHDVLEHCSGRKTRDFVRPIPKHTDAVIVLLDRISHALPCKVRTDASRIGVPVYTEKRGRQNSMTLWAGMGQAQ